MIRFHDVRYGLRILLKQPTFTLVAVLTLALGIGANTAIFSVVNGVLLHPLPYGEPDRLVVVWGTVGDNSSAPSSAADFLDWRRQNRVFDGLAALFPAALTLTGADEPERLRGLQVTPNFFEVLGVEPSLGSGFTLDTESVGEAAVLLSHEFWQRRFGGRPSVINETLALDGKIYSIAGVMPAGFQFATEEADVWVRPPRDMPVPPIDLPDELDVLTFRGLHWLHVIGRLSPGATVEEAQAAMDVISRRLAGEYEDDAGRGARVVRLQDQVVGDVRPALLVLLGAVGFVLLIACGNVANLLLARATGRVKEIAIRTALGASRGRLIGQLLTESVALAMLGGALGLFFAFWTVDLILALSPDVLPRISVIGLDGGVFSFTLAVSVITGLVFGLLPALQASNPDIQGTLKEGGHSSGGGERNRLRASLVVAELGLASVLLIGAVLLARSFAGLQNVDPGFVPDKVLTLRLWLPELRYPDDDEIAGFYDDVLDRVRNLPGVQSASAVLGVPLSGSSASFGFSIEGRPKPPPGEEYTAGFQSVGRDYFQTMGIPLVGGRDFDERDDADAPSVAVINETLARRYWPEEDPIGRRVSLDDEDWIEIVGVVRDVRHQGLDSEPRAELYLPYRQAPLRFMTLVVKTQSEPLELAGAVRSQVLAVDGNLPIFKVMSLEQIVSDSVAQPRFNMTLVGAFSFLALLLAAIGIYGVMSYTVSRRTHELGIRIAMGACTGDLLKMVVRQGMGLIAAGIGVGLLAAWALTRVLSGFLFGVTPTDPLTFIGVSFVLAFVALLATVLPARRAARVDPLNALRYE
jgi:putative ABC transport system permease protein